MLAKQLFRFSLLDGLRGLAAFFVLFRHFSLDGRPHPSFASFLAVDFFFVLSGFVLEPGLRMLNGERTPLVKYMLKRALRLWPAYLVGFCLSLTVALMTPDGVMPLAKLEQIPGGLLMLPLLKAPISGALYPDALFPIMLPTWSLFAEFYLANLLFALAYGRLGLRFAASVAIIAGLGFVACTLIHGNGDFGGTWKSLPGTACRVLFSFGVGVLLRRGRERVNLLLPRYMGVIMVLALTAILAAPSDLMTPAFSLLTVLVAFPALVFVASFIQLRGVELMIAEVSGEISYPLYVLHPGLGGLSVLAYAHTSLKWPHPTLIVAILLLPITFAFARFYEEPFRQFLTRRLVKPTASTEVRASMG